MKRTKSMIYAPSHESRELFLSIVNTESIYKNSVLPMIDLLKKHYKKNRYNTDKAVNAWYIVATEGAKEYQKEYGSKDWKFSVKDRFTTATELEQYFFEDIENA